jgi:hypothetical protein
METPAVLRVSAILGLCGLWILSFAMLSQNAAAQATPVPINGITFGTIECANSDTPNTTVFHTWSAVDPAAASTCSAVTGPLTPPVDLTLTNADTGEVVSTCQATWSGYSTCGVQNLPAGNYTLTEGRNGYTSPPVSFSGDGQILGIWAELHTNRVVIEEPEGDGNGLISAVALDCDEQSPITEPTVDFLITYVGSTVEAASTNAVCRFGAPGSSEGELYVDRLDASGNVLETFQITISAELTNVEKPAGYYRARFVFITGEEAISETTTLSEGETLLFSAYVMVPEPTPTPTATATTTVTATATVSPTESPAATPAQGSMVTELPNTGTEGQAGDGTHNWMLLVLGCAVITVSAGLPIFKSAGKRISR